jgi:hypothetical protein
MQINHFTNNTHFSPLAKGRALGATRLASPANTQRVGNRPTAKAKKTAQLLLNKFIIEFFTPGEQKGALESLIGKSLESLLLNQFRMQIESGKAFELEAKFLKRLLALAPEGQKAKYVEDFYQFRLSNAIAVGTVSPGDDFSDPVVKYLTRLVNGKRTRAKKS